MARHRKSVVENEMNGNPGKRQLPQVTLEGSHLPVGDPPKGMAKDEQESWQSMVRSMPWLNATHRGHLEIACRAACHFKRLDKHFANRRAAMKRAKEPEVHAFLNDAMTRPHPLMSAYRDARDTYRSMLAELGGNPSVQARLLGYIDDAMRKREKQKREQEENFLT